MLHLRYILLKISNEHLSCGLKHTLFFSVILWERDIGTLASSLAVGLGWVVGIIVMRIYDSGHFLPADVLV
jgi:hypothetical protein